MKSPRVTLEVHRRLRLDSQPKASYVEQYNVDLAQQLKQIVV